MVRREERVSFASRNDNLARPSSQAVNPAHLNFHIPSCSPACYCDGHFPGHRGREVTANGPIHGRAGVADDAWAGLFVLDQPARDQAENGDLGTRIADRLRVFSGDSFLPARILAWPRTLRFHVYNLRGVADGFNPPSLGRLTATKSTRSKGADAVIGSEIQNQMPGYPSLNWRRYPSHFDGPESSISGV